MSNPQKTSRDSGVFCYGKTMKPTILMPVAMKNSHYPPTYGLNEVYIDAVSSHGGFPLMIARPEAQELETLLPHVHGILLSGGIDVDPIHYHEVRDEQLCNIDAPRDRVELYLVMRARELNIPLLGICRGMQLINVALGGSLYQDLPTQFQSTIEHRADDTHERAKIMHEVILNEDARLAKITNTTRLMVNSLHHQGVKVLADELVPEGKSPDGLVEAFTHRTHPFLIGVEWHPEELGDEPSKRIFDAFISAAQANIAPVAKNE